MGEPDSVRGQRESGPARYHVSLEMSRSVPPATWAWTLTGGSLGDDDGLPLGPCAAGHGAGVSWRSWLLGQSRGRCSSLRRLNIPCRAIPHPH